MSEMWKIGLLKNPRKMASYVSFAYINNLYKTIQQNNKAPEKANERLPFVQGKIMVLLLYGIKFDEFLRLHVTDRFV